MGEQAKSKRETKLEMPFKSIQVVAFSVLGKIGMPLFLRQAQSLASGIVAVKLM